MSIFQTGDAPCGVFRALDGFGTQQSIAFVRAQTSQNSAGDTLLSFIDIGTFSMDLQPLPSEIKREIGGIVVQMSHRAIVPGKPDIQELDRCFVDGWQLEVVQAAHYGEEHTELDFREVGR